MTYTFTFESINGFLRSRGAHPIWALLDDGNATFDRGTLVLTADCDDAEAVAIRRLVDDANGMWASASDSDPAATPAQRAAIVDLTHRPETQILRLENLVVEDLTRSQASRLIECATDIVKNGY